MKKIKLPKLTLRSILNNNKQVVALSLVLAIAFWVSTSIRVSPESTKVIHDVPVSIDLSIPNQYDLKPFSDIALKIDVTIKGKKSKLINANIDTILASINASEVNKEGTYSLPIDIKIVDEKRADFQIDDSTLRQTVRIWFDLLSKGTANIETDIAGQENIADGYVMGEPALSTDVVTYSGPNKEFSRVEKIVAKATLKEKTTEAITVEPTVVALDSKGNVVNNISFEYGQSKLSLVVPILKKATLPLGVNFINAPLGFTENKFSISYSPATLEFATNESTLSTMKKLTIGDIDFSKLSVGKNTFDFKLTSINNIVPLNTSLTTASVTIDLSGYGVSLYTVEKNNIQITNCPAGYTAQVISSKIDNVGVLGLPVALAKVTTADIYAVIDLTNATTERASYSKALDAKLTVKNQSECWVTGYYKVEVQITKS